MDLISPNVLDVLAMVLALIGPPPADSPQQLQLKPGDQIVAIGDSITQQGGYLGDIDAVLARAYPDLKLPKVINKGISGQKAEDLARRFDADVVKLKPAWVTLSIGINDVWHRLGAPHDPEVLAAYKKNVATMVDQAQQAGIRVILLAPTLIQEDPKSQGNQRLIQYVDAEKQVAAEKKCQFVDLHGMFLAALKHKPASEKGNWLTGDGVHMKPLGDAAMAAGVLRALGVPDEKIAGVTLGGLVPQPVSLEPGRGSFTLTSDTVIVADEASRATAEQLADFLKPATGLGVPLQSARKGAESVIVLAQDAGLADLGGEGYLLEVKPEEIRLAAPTQAGLFYAAETLRQLFPPQVYAREAVKGVAWQAPCVKIKDFPRFGWRGLMLDSGHDFQTLDFVYKFIDAMAAHKFNVLHWHLTDLGTWSIEIKKYPKLIAALTRGRGVKPGYYTQDEVRQVVAYAARRHITVVPEIEMPGHSVAALLAYPELNCPLKGGQIWQYCAGNEKTFEFLDDVLSEVLDLFPSKFVHVGGDECPKDRWRRCPLCQARMKAEKLRNENELQSYFIKRIEKFLDGKGRRLIGWDEILEGGLAAQGHRHVVAGDGRRDHGGQERPRRGDGPHQPPVLRLSLRGDPAREGLQFRTNSQGADRRSRPGTCSGPRRRCGATRTRRTARWRRWSIPALRRGRGALVAGGGKGLSRFPRAEWPATRSGWRPWDCIITRCTANRENRRKELGRKEYGPILRVAGFVRS